MSARTAIAVLLLSAGQARLFAGPVLQPEAFRFYADRFHRLYPEEVVNAIPDADAWLWLQRNIPLFGCPDASVEELYYYRWWAYRKHLKKTPKGFILTEFLKPVRHAAEYNAISCAFGHHVAEGRWLHDAEYLKDYIAFWLTSGEHGALHSRFHQFSGWAAATLYNDWLVTGDRPFLLSYLNPLIADYAAWEHDHMLPSGLFWQTDVADGMEESISGGRKVKNARPSINSYMYGNAVAIAKIAEMAREPERQREYQERAARLRTLVDKKLWNEDARFFETQLESGKLADVREEIGFTPWYFDLPPPKQGYEEAWKQIIDPHGFYAPYGPPTAEMRSQRFIIADKGDECQWNGPGWPFATSITLTALANVLNGYQQRAVDRAAYFEVFMKYTKSQHRRTEQGVQIPWIDENLNPITGEWQARAMKVKNGTFYGRGDHYNHSTYADLVITGIVGLRPRPDDQVEVNPLIPEKTWDWFCLDNVLYHGRTLTIVWDRNGKKFREGRGLRVLANGRQIASAPELRRLTARLP